MSSEYKIITKEEIRDRKFQYLLSAYIKPGTEGKEFLGRFSLMTNVKGFMSEPLTGQGDKFVAWHTNQFGQIVLIEES